MLMDFWTLHIKTFDLRASELYSKSFYFTEGKFDPECLHLVSSGMVNYPRTRTLIKSQKFMKEHQYLFFSIT